jgi:polyhydroxybutyrate depolymerase
MQSGADSATLAEMQHVLLLAIGVSLGLTACGSDDDTDGDGSGGSSGSSGSAGATGDTRSSPGCTSPSLGAGDHDGTLAHGGVDRTYKVHVPASYDPAKPTPMMLNFHGLTPIVGPQAAESQANLSKMVPKSDSAGFILVHPQGLLHANGTTASWNSGACCAEDKTIDDVGFIRALIDELGTELCVDERRVYAAGMSNGGMMSHFLGCHLADKLAAIAPVAGLNGSPTCEPGRPLGVIAFHGTTDNLVPYDSGVQAIDGWVQRNGCNSEPSESFRNGDSHCDTYSGCQDGVEVVFCTVDDGGHTWPGGTPLPANVPGLPDLGKTTMDVIANDAIWEHFLSHTLP